MSTLLYITAHPHDHETSFSMATGKAFIDAYRESHPSDEVVHLDLYRSDIPHIDADVFSGWGKLQSGSDLTSEEQAKVSRLNELSDQFASADKYVFVTPMWNFSFPPILKAYVDSICVAAKHSGIQNKVLLDCCLTKKRCIFKHAVAFIPKAQRLRWNPVIVI